MATSLSDTAKRSIDLGLGKPFTFYSLTALEEGGLRGVARLPRSLKVVLESVLRNCDGRSCTEDQVRALAGWQPNGARETEVPFTVGCIVLNCAAGIPLLGDLTAIRGAVQRMGFPAGSVQPKVPVDMALDHTLTVDHHASHEALALNMGLDIERNEERYRFVKWAMQAYDGIRLFPPGSGILHQLNLEFLAPGLLFRDGTCFPDTLVGTDSHTCMIAGLGVVGWGVGGIEAETAMLGQPVLFQQPDVVGVHVSGTLAEGVTATDLVLHATELFRRTKVVGKFLEFFGEAVSRLTVPDRATLSNMAPEYGATIGYFPVDEQTCRYLRQTGRPEADVQALETYFRAQGCFGAARPGEVDYTSVIELDLSAVEPSVAGPKRPQDRVPLRNLKARFREVLHQPVAEGGYGRLAATRPPHADETAAGGPRSAHDGGASFEAELRSAPQDEDRESVGSEADQVRDGDVVIAAITSCTNTSNPGVMLAAGLVARKAVERGLTTKPWVKTSLTPGSLVVGRYLEDSGLQRDLDALGFEVVGYSCATCVGASGPIDAALEQDIAARDVVACAVLSGNRNFEARIHPAVRASFLMSPPLVVAFAVAGRVDIDLATEPLGHDRAGSPVFLRDIWPSSAEIDRAFALAVNPGTYQEIYAHDPAENNPAWGAIPHPTGEVYPWGDGSTYIKEPPFLTAELQESTRRDILNARVLLLLGDSVTTDHISPIGTIKAASPAGRYLARHSVAPADFNNFGARRMNHDVMIRGAFSNARLKNRLVPGVEGGFTLHRPGGEQMSVFDASTRYGEEGVPLVIVAGEEYGTGSARDWAAKATRLLGVRAVVAKSFERIHRSNLVGMGVLPCQLPDDVAVEDLALDGSEILDITGIEEGSGGSPTLVIRRADRRTATVPLTLRLDTAAEALYVEHGGIMPFLLSELLARAAAA